MREIEGQNVEHVAIVDDEEPSQEGYNYTVEDAHLHGLLETGPLPGVDRYIESLRGRADAVLCDYRLRVHGGYATFDGAELAARCYETAMPAVLCTRYDEAAIEEIRPYRRFVPCLLNPSELNPDSLLSAIGTNLREFAGKFGEDRKSWRALVRIEDRDDEKHVLFVELPSFRTDLILRIPLSMIPEQVQRVAQPGKRLHVHTNLGASKHEELFFEHWEER